MEDGQGQPLSGEVLIFIKTAPLIRATDKRCFDTFMGPLFSFYLLFWLLPLSSLVAGEKKVRVEFSADVTRTFQGQPEKSQYGRMVVSRYGIRTEGKKDGLSVTVIFRPKKQIIWTLFPEQKWYEERIGVVVNRPPLPRDPHSPCQRDKQIICQLLGHEVFQARQTEHWLISQQTGQQKLRPIVQLWIDQKLQIALREQFSDGMTVELSHIEEKPQSIKSFVVPGDYTKRALKPGEKKQGVDDREILKR
ncbi:MAG: hypothetical protein HQL72_10025 [Magnetococcales bacterium]|nr:hypothetical protein [Magnetococcales bacterium]